jgi:hypothetical protein
MGEYLIPYRDDLCPERGPALSHMAEPHAYVCAECGMQCMIESVIVEDEGVLKAVMIYEPECIVDHDSLVSNYDGVRWARCVQCAIMVETRHEPRGPQGPAWGPGRFGSPRAEKEYQARLDYMKWYYNAKVEP